MAGALLFYICVYLFAIHKFVCQMPLNVWNINGVQYISFVWYAQRKENHMHKWGKAFGKNS